MFLWAILTFVLVLKTNVLLINISAFDLHKFIGRISSITLNKEIYNPRGVVDFPKMHRKQHAQILAQSSLPQSKTKPRDRAFQVKL